MASASASHRRVDPSTSVNRNVTTPDGAAAADTLTGCHKERRRTLNNDGPVLGDGQLRQTLSHMAGGDADAAAKWIEHDLAEDIDGQQG
jgi:hypothetical protein